MSPMSPPKPCMAAWDCAAAAAAAKPLPPAGPSWLKIAVPHNTSDKFAPGSTVTKFELLFLFTAPMNAANFSSFASISPKETTSTATLHLRNFFPTATSSFSSTLIGLPINNTIRMRWCLFCLCFNAKCATCTPTQMLISPSILIPCTELSTAPKSCVGVTSTRGTLPAKLNTPTAFSGLLCVLAPASKFTASASAYVCEQKSCIPRQSTRTTRGAAQIISRRRSNTGRKRINIAGARAHLKPGRCVIAVSHVFAVV